MKVFKNYFCIQIKNNLEIKISILFYCRIFYIQGLKFKERQLNNNDQNNQKQYFVQQNKILV